MDTGESREEITARIKDQADLVQVIGECVELKRSGARYLGLCPFHGEKTPSFSVHGGKQFYHCFGCGESGDVFSFVMKYNGLDFPGAVKVLANRYQIALPERHRSKAAEQRRKNRELLFLINKRSADLYSRYLSESPAAKGARAYLQKRGVGDDLQKKFAIGYAPAVEVEGWNFLGSQFTGLEAKSAVEAGLLVNKEGGRNYDRFRDRIVFPILDINGRICGFTGRIVGDGQPKYLNSPDNPVYNKSKLLFGLFQQKEYIRQNDTAILVEGNFDLVSLVAHGCKNVVAPLGTALTREQLRLIRRFSDKVTLLFDGDEAGGKAAARVVLFFLSEQVSGRVALLPKGHDPDTFIREKGLAELNQLIERAEPLPEFVLNRWIEEYGLTLDGKRRIVEELRPLIKTAQSPLQRSVFVSHFADKLGIPEDKLDASLDDLKRDQPGPIVKPMGESREGPVMPLSMPQRQLIEFMILQPQYFAKLEEENIRACLEGGMGEVIFLQFKRLLDENPEMEPKELLTVLPEGAEWNLVADLLINAPNRTQAQDNGATHEELDDLLNYLKKFQLKKGAEALMERMQRAQEDGDIGLAQELMTEKVKITRKLLGEEA